MHVRVTKPVIPKTIMDNYEAMESQKTKLLIAAEAAKVAAQEAETDKMRATVEAEKVAAVSKIRVEMQIAFESSICFSCLQQKSDAHREHEYKFRRR